MSETQLTTAEFAAEYTKDIQTSPDPKAESKSPSFEEFSKARAEGKITGHEEESEPAPAKPEVAPRDDKGRFSRVRESLRQAEVKGSYVKGIVDGHIRPDESMDTSTWIRAREAELRNRTSGITVPEELLKQEQPASVAKPEANGPELSAEEIRAFEAHEGFMGQLAAKLAVDPGARDAMAGIQTAISRGVDRDAISYMGILISGEENSYEILQALAKAPDVIETYCRLSPSGMAKCIKALSQEIAQTKVAQEKKQAPPKPAPPSPVGARAASVAFDVNDDKTDGETWVKQRWKQIHESRNRG